MSEVEKFQCRICDNRDRNKIYKVREMMLGKRDMHNYFECADCGCLQIAEVPENIQEYYPSDDYYSYDAVKAVSGLKGKLVRQRDRFAATGVGFIGNIMQQIQPHDKLPSLQATNINLESKILDVGCGAGHLLHSMQEAGFKNLLGIDPFNSDDIQYDNGLTIVKSSIHDLPSNGKSDTENGWDLIMFNHSYEHVLDQIEVLEKTRKLLKPDGICMLRIPTVTSWAWRHYAENWVQLDAPRHFFLHSIKSIHILAEKTGFSLEDVIYDSFAFQSWGSEQYQQDIALNDESSYAMNPEKSQFTKKEIANYEEHSKVLNKSKAGDQAAFYLKKTS
jgi:2-polyprenyl-3-methyl-5-hydroxy-6-metoxy-1,4-benzoquinol methylase/Fe-S cluster biosynthesis and repair protein YggX